MELRGREGALMRRRRSVSTVAMIMTAMMGTAAVVPARGQHHGGCDGHEGDHGRGCLATTDECEDGGWQPFEVLKNIFENQGRCV